MNNTGKPQRQALPPGTNVTTDSGEKGGGIIHGTIVEFDHSDHVFYKSGNYYKIKPSPAYMHGGQYWFNGSRLPNFVYRLKLDVKPT